MHFSLTSNLIVTLGSQIYMALLGVAVLPLYLKYMGPEAYGLIGFFSMLQVWFTLLDLGLTPTLSREVARFRANKVSAEEFAQLYQAMSFLFFFLAIVGGGILLFFSHGIASHWLKVKTLGIHEVEFCIKNMAICSAFRWLSGLYRGVITGAERLVWLGSFNIVIATFRFLLVIPLMWYFGANLRLFFVYQTIVACIEIGGLWFKSKTLKPSISSPQLGWGTLAPLKTLFRFSFVIAFTSSVWIIITQADKFILSHQLSLEEYGYFTLAVLSASGILAMISPISTTIMPRLATLEAEGNQIKLLQTYRDMTQFVTVIVGSISIALVFCSKSLLWVWLGDRVIAEKIAPILKLYAAGNGIFALVAFPYYLQYAKGNLRLHFIGHFILLSLFLPVMIWITLQYGAIGAGYTWVLTNTLYLLGWCGVIHRWIEPGLHKQWLLNDIFKIFCLLMVVGITCSFIPTSSYSKIANLIHFSGCILTALFLSSLSTRFVQIKIKKILFERRKKIQHVN